MKKLLLLLICLFAFVGCSDEYSHEIDLASTAKAQWAVNQNVAEIATGSVDAPKLSYIYRKFLGCTVNGYYLVQEFYDDGKKRTDPYLIVEEKYIDQIRANRGAKGIIKSYYHSGQKLSEGFAKNNWWDGTATMWYEDGKKQSESFHQNRRMIHYTEWYSNGQMKADVSYKEGSAPQISERDEHGNVKK